MITVIRQESHGMSGKRGNTWVFIYFFPAWVQSEGKKNKHGGTAQKWGQLLSLNLVAIKKLVAESSWQTGRIDTANRQMQLADKILQKI